MRSPTKIQGFNWHVAPQILFRQCSDNIATLFSLKQKRRPWRTWSHHGCKLNPPAWPVAYFRPSFPMTCAHVWCEALVTPAARRCSANISRAQGGCQNFKNGETMSPRASRDWCCVELLSSKFICLLDVQFEHETILIYLHVIRHLVKPVFCLHSEKERNMWRQYC